MNSKKIILIIAMVLIFILIVTLILLSQIKNIEDSSSEEENENTTIAVEDRQEGGAEYDISALKNVELEFYGLTEEIEGYIPDKTIFENKIKEFIYKKGLIDAKTATISEWNVIQNELILSVKLDNSKETILNVVINLDNNEYQITM